jgi:hypothetical protein
MPQTPRRERLVELPTFETAVVRAIKEEAKRRGFAKGGRTEDLYIVGECRDSIYQRTREIWSKIKGEPASRFPFTKDFVLLSGQAILK